MHNLSGFVLYLTKFKAQYERACDSDLSSTSTQSHEKEGRKSSIKSCIRIIDRAEIKNRQG